MCFPVFANIGTHFPRTSRLCLCMLEYYRKIRGYFAFSDSRTPHAMWRFINTPDRISARKIPRPVLILSYRIPLPKKFPAAALAVKLKCYMDDYLDTLESELKAIQRADELVALWKLGCFKLTKFVSNIPNLA